MERFFVLVKKQKSTAFYEKRWVILTSKNKRISKKISSHLSLIIFLALVIFLPFAQIAHAEAKSPLQNLIDFSNQKIRKTKTIVISSNQPENIEQVQQVEALLLGGKKLSVPAPVSNPKETEKAAEFASSATGVSKDFLMGMMVVESNLGQNSGNCTYREVEQGAQESHSNGQLSNKAWETFQNRREVIKNLAKDLGYDYEQLKVSCNPGVAYAGTGGAMGIPQFMPDIWMAYRDRIAAIVGKDNPDPWDVKDGAVAMALLVSDTPGVTEHNYYAQRNAAKMYLSGTTSWKYDWYANQIFYWSRNYQQLLG